MNREDIVRMAQEAEHLVIEDYYTNGPVRAFSEAQLERFAALVASAERERLTEAAMKAAEKAVDVAMALEREACAQMLEAASKTGKIISCTTAAKAIRARG
jgi:hypothetical protein